MLVGRPWFFRLLFLLTLVVCSYGFLKDVSGLPSSWMPNDKLMHGLIFLMLMLLWQLSFYRRVLAGLLLLGIYGGAIELAQHFFTTRFGDWWDFLADLGGLALALLLWQLPLWRRFQQAPAEGTR